jgi:hypothetical protein
MENNENTSYSQNRTWLIVKILIFLNNQRNANLKIDVFYLLHWKRLNTCVMPRLSETWETRAVWKGKILLWGNVSIGNKSLVSRNPHCSGLC